MVKGGSLKSCSRRSSRVQVPSSAYSFLVFILMIVAAIAMGDSADVKRLIRFTQPLPFIKFVLEVNVNLKIFETNGYERAMCGNDRYF